ncbi:hypothetical protein K6U06_16940 [Acidiferrimicrobium sp. IK]|uniref:hypothetical protein n=1 Tax=Acidiferrimicrobium sp. IK TaxID=2871700 RepID=UPI0021CB10D1|nr:hypothetical protein [Acidiferrimicrobium sp. IK]MCU4186058.1 hypothetical protein [Acidiferrimicrobium sp. IK]
MPGRAGQFLVVGAGRIAVENLAERRAFDVLARGSPLEAVRPGAIFSPADRCFEVRLVGSLATYTIVVDIVTGAADSPAVTGEDACDPGTRLEPELTARQWQVMAEYIRPILAGSPVPATHAAVAEALGWSMALIRVECAEIWNRFVLADVPMRDFPDKRDAIVDAAIRHRLLPE